MARTQVTDFQICTFQSSPLSTLVVEAVPLANSSDPLYCDTITGTQWLLVSLDRWCTAYDSLHGLSHSVIWVTQKLITARFVWPGINTDICCSCIKCQHAKIQRYSHTLLSSFLVPEARFYAIHIDLVGPLPTSRGFTYLLSVWTISPGDQKLSHSCTSSQKWFLKLP